jgi:glycosyltransferase involved in cell wall biosynthesis/acetyltransferase-like isoleucine patch superfamily enzyme
MPITNIRILAMLEASYVSGSAKAVLEFYREARRQSPGQPEIEPSIVMFSRGQDVNSLAEPVRAAGIPLEIIAERGRFDRGVVPQLQAVIKKLRPAIIWSNSVKSHFLVRFAGLNRSSKWVAFHHGYTTTHATMRLYNHLDRWSLPAANRVVTVCHPFARELQARHVRAERIRVQQMPIRPFPAIPPDVTLGLRRQLGISDSTPVILSVGRLSQEKGHVDLLRAFSLVRDRRPTPRLIIVGEGPERRAIERLCSELELAGVVTLAGHQDDVQPYYALADLFVLPSHSEGSPNVLLEAMAAGVPVVATAVGGVPEIVTDGSDALLVEKRNPEALAATITRLLDDDELREGNAPHFPRGGGTVRPRLIAKRLVQAVSLAIVFPAALLSGFGRSSIAFTFFAHLFAMVPGILGDFWRSSYYKLTLRECSIDTVIAFGSFFSRRDACIGPNVSIGAYCVIGRARIGARTQISSHVEIPSGRHQHLRDSQGRFGNSIDSEVLIGSDCWIGASAIVMANVGSGATIGAGSVVVKDIPDGVVAVGNPATTVRVPGDSPAPHRESR